MTEQVKQKESTPKQSSPRPSSILNKKKEITYKDIISFCNDNIMKIFMETISIIVLILFLSFYIRLRKAKKEEIQKLMNSPDPKQSKCQKKYEENGCDKINDSTEAPPLLQKLCIEFDQCRHQKSVIPTISELCVEHCGLLVQEFIHELKMKTVLTIFVILGILILVDTLRNRPRFVI